MNRSTLNAKVENAAIKTYNQVQDPSSYRDQGHNEFFNKMCNNLHAEGISFQREKIVGGRKPDIYIEGFGAVEVKAKGQLTQDDRAQAEHYARNSSLPCKVINFGNQNGPHIRDF